MAYRGFPVAGRASGLRAGLCIAFAVMVLRAPPAHAQCQAEEPTTGEFRRELSSILAQRDAQSPAAVEAALLPLVQAHPCVPAAVLPLAEALLAQSKRAAALTILAPIAELPAVSDNRPLIAAQTLWQRLQHQVQLRLRFAGWVPPDAALRVTGPEGPVALGQRDGLHEAWVDPGDYRVVCEGQLLDPSPQWLHVEGSAPLERVITPAPLYLPVAPADFASPAREQLVRAQGAAELGDWPAARDGLRAVLGVREHPKVRFNLAYTYLRLGDPLSAFITLASLSGLPVWAQPLAEHYRARAQAKLVAIDVAAPPGTQLRIDGRPVVRSGTMLVKGAPTETPARLPARALVMLSAAPAYDMELQGGPFHVRLRVATRERELERRDRLRVELAAGARAELTLERAPVPPVAADGPSLVGPLVLLAGAGALGAASLWGFYLPARDLRDSADCDPNGSCAHYDRIERARDKADVASLTAGVASALVVGGVTWGLIEWLTAAPDAPNTAMGVRLSPTGLQLGGTL